MRVTCVRRLARIQNLQKNYKKIQISGLTNISRTSDIMADKTFKLNTGQEIPALMFGTAPQLP